MIELFEDFTVLKVDHKDFVKIAKREYNPELSLVSNLVLDLVDFKDRVRPLAKDINLIDASRRYQRTSVDEMEKRQKEMEEMI